MVISRRDILRAMGCGAVSASLPGIGLASAKTDSRFVLVILRGALDGLAVAAPYGEGRYRRLRGELAMPRNTPFVLRGNNSVTSWAPSRLPDTDDDTLRRLEAVYAPDEFFSTRLTQALESQQIAGNMVDKQQTRRRLNGAAYAKSMMQSAGKFLAAPGGPRIAVVELGGWDTHANQGATRGSLANKLAALDQGIEALRLQLDTVWSDTVVAVVTEFGRTVRVNGTRGTDHGTGTAALLLGGAVNGGRVITDWPGLATRDLYDGRDLYPTTDIRSIFKGILAEHMQLAAEFLDATVFPNSLAAPITQNLIRT